MLEAYLVVGFLYTAWVYATTPAEDRKINSLPSFGNVAVTAVGCALLWPMVAYINHLWRPKE